MSKSTQVEALYNCTVPTKTPVDLLVLLGNSMANGYSSLRANVDASVSNYYVPSAGVQTWHKIFNISINGLGYFSGWSYATANYSGLANTFCVDASMMKVISDHYSWPRPLYLYVYCLSGTSLVNGESADTWSSNDADGHLFMAINNYYLPALKECINYLRYNGKEPRIFVLWGANAISNTYPLAATYQTEINGIISYIRTQLNDNTIRFYWSKCDPQYAYPIGSVASNGGCDLVTTADPLVESYDSGDLKNASGHWYATSEITRGLLNAAYWYEKFYGNSRPTCTGVSITGVIANSQYVGFTYTYSDPDGDLEDRTIVADTMRLNDGSGTRCELWRADDNVGTGQIFSYALNYGETVQLSSASGKYWQARVWVKAQTGALHGYCIKGSWQGPTP